MTYESVEESVFNAQPIELYEFFISPKFWRHTSADEDKTFQSNTFTAIPIRRTKIEQNPDPARNPISINVSKTMEFARKFRASPPDGVVTLKIFRKHESDAGFVTAWIGRVVNVSFKNDEAIISGESILTAVKRIALRRTYQKACPYVLYGSGCNLSKASFQVNATLSGVSGATLISSTFGTFTNGHFTGGFVEWSDTEGVLNTRFIISHTGNNIVVESPFISIPANANVAAFPGCDRQLTTCINKFSNEVNYGGFPYIPEKNPFDTNPIW